MWYQPRKQMPVMHGDIGCSAMPVVKCCHELQRFAARCQNHRGQNTLGACVSGALMARNATPTTKF